MKPASTIAVAAGAFLAGMGLIALAFGPLNPPAGPVAPSYKTLQEIEPRLAINATNTPGDADSLFKITQPGSYYLTGNITGVAGKHGIEIVSSSVTIDLNGFDLAGVAGMGAFDGVSATVGGLANIAVVNGSVRSWARDGVNLGDLSVTNCHIDGVRASSNARVGLYSGPNSRVSNCSAKGSQYGLWVLYNSTVSGCSTISCSIVGINTDFGCSVANCSANANAGIGFRIGGTNSLHNCSSSSNGVDGFSVASGSTITGCSASSNTGNGIVVASGVIVEGCTVVQCTLDGIQCVAACIVRGNNCLLNGNNGDGAGIHAISGDNRIEGNNCSGADRGIDVDLAGNIIIQNVCSGNTTDWDVVANNVVGPILDRRAPASAAIIGFSFAGSLGSTDPNANFSY